MIGIVKLLKASGIGIKPDDLKIHLACWNKHEHPLDVFFAGGFEEWQRWQTKRNFECAQVLSLIDLGQNRWLFAGVHEVLGSKPHPECSAHFRYSTRLLKNQNDLIGRVVVQHKRSGRASYIWNRPEIALTVLEIREEKMTVHEFPGYNRVIVSHSNLRLITQQKIASWHGALANVKGIYLITDTSSGKHYVGKASGNEGIWQRWCAYADTGHGGNKELRRLLKANGEGHAQNFQYSILEIADTHASDDDILARESHWMEALKTRDFGLN